MRKIGEATLKGGIKGDLPIDPCSKGKRNQGRFKVSVQGTRVSSCKNYDFTFDFRQKGKAKKKVHENG